MSILDIHVLGSPILRAETKVVAEVSDDLRKLANDMFETMYKAKGIGLAAPQVGRSERLAVVDVEDQRYALVNPEIVWEEGSDRAEEGCLSIPDIYGDVDRATRVLVRAMDLEGNPIEIEATDLLARCLQHEIDHLHGRLFIDYLSFLKRRAAIAKWETMRDKYPGLLRRTATEIEASDTSPAAARADEAM
ncbi:MAG TPA: peptide deformylase [Gemmatimonadaceae bacterium]|nr:peptide deformylase [Gemmatimonadaceae bacterium]